MAPTSTSPRQAYIGGLKSGPSEHGRAIASKSPKFSMLYAEYVDNKNEKQIRNHMLSTPANAYFYSKLKRDNKSKRFRNAVLASPKYSYLYARDIDAKPTKKTMKAVLPSPLYSYLYARDVLKKHSKELMQSVLCSPLYSYLYARDVKRKRSKKLGKVIAGSIHERLYNLLTKEVGVLNIPKDKDGNYLSNSPEEAVLEAKKSGPSKLARSKVLTSPCFALEWAEDIDEEPREDTRNAVLSDPYYAYSYAISVDNKPTEETYLAVIGTSCEKWYLEYFDLEEDFDWPNCFMGDN